jgi:amino-acid N-acetyltransferase
MMERTPASVRVFPDVLALRQATEDDVPAIHALVDRHVTSDHLLPRGSEEIQSHCDRFVVATMNGEVVGCAELAPLSPQVAEVRSLVVEADARGVGLGRRMVDALVARATELGYARLCAFSHQPGYFVRLGFSIVPHLWLREKVFTDCVSCPLFRGCGQQAVVVSLEQYGARSIGAVA